MERSFEGVVHSLTAQVEGRFERTISVDRDFVVSEREARRRVVGRAQADRELRAGRDVRRAAHGGVLFCRRLDLIVGVHVEVGFRFLNAERCVRRLVGVFEFLTVVEGIARAAQELLILNRELGRELVAILERVRGGAVERVLVDQDVVIARLFVVDNREDFREVVRTRKVRRVHDVRFRVAAGVLLLEDEVGRVRAVLTLLVVQQVL